jgi:hypothetical protein
LSRYWILNVFDRRVAGITLEQLSAYFTGVTDLLGKARTDRNINKRIRVSGNLSRYPLDSAWWTRTALVTITDRSGLVDVEAHCLVKGRKDVARLKAMGPDSEVTLIGRISAVTKEAIILDPCKVVT